VGFAEEVSASKLGMGGEDLVGAVVEAVVVDCVGERVRRSLGEGGVEVSGQV
jgi:hypothetical protein